MLNTRSSKASSRTKDHDQAHFNSESGTAESSVASTMDVISKVVAAGLSSTFETMKSTVTANIKDNGEQYLADALTKLKDAASHVAVWGKRNPVKTAVAAAAVLAVTAFLVATIKSHPSADTSPAESENDRDDQPSAKNPGRKAPVKSAKMSEKHA